MTQQSVWQWNRSFKGTSKFIWALQSFVWRGTGKTKSSIRKNLSLKEELASIKEELQQYKQKVIFSNVAAAEDKPKKK